MTRPPPTLTELANLDSRGLAHLLRLWQGGASAQTLLQAGLLWLEIPWGGLFAAKMQGVFLVASVGRLDPPPEQQDIPLEWAGRSLGFLRLPTGTVSNELEALCRLLALWLEADSQQAEGVQTQERLETENRRFESLFHLGLQFAAQQSSAQVIAQALEFIRDLLGAEVAGFWQEVGVGQKVSLELVQTATPSALEGELPEVGFQLDPRLLGVSLQENQNASDPIPADQNLSDPPFQAPVLGWRSVLWRRVRLDTKSAGVFLLGHRTVGFFDSVAQTWLECVVALTQVALDNAQVLEQSLAAQQAAQCELAQFEALQSLELELVAQRDPRRVVERALELCCSLFGAGLGSYWRQFSQESLEGSYLELRLKVGEVLEPLNVQVGLQEGAVGWVARSGQALRIPDYWEYPFRDRKIKTPHRSLLLTPLIYNGQTLGVLELADPRPHLFSPEDLGRFQRFGRLVAVALHNARLFEQTLHAEREAQRRADLLETLTEMSRELSQELEPSRLYNSILERLTRMFEAHEAGLYLLSPDREQLLLLGETGREGTPTMQLGEGAAGWVVLEGEALRLDDYAAWPQRSEPEKPTPMRALMAVPLGSALHPLGALVVADHQRVGRFTPEDLEMLSRFAALATVALENAQLYQMARLGARFERLRSHISSTVTASRSVREFCEKLLEEISLAFGYRYLSIDLLEVSLLGEARLRCQASLGYQKVVLEMPLSQGVGGRVARSGVGEWIPDARQDPDWMQADPHLNQMVCVPLKARGQVLGVLGVESDAEAPLSPSDLGQLEAISEAVSFALENILLVETLEKRTRELEKAHREADYAATHDVLTRLPNRRAFERDARRSLEQALEEASSVTLAVIDLSGFKAVNDRMGHSAGDHALQRISHVLASSCPKAYRVGGDEFLLLLEMNTPRAIEVSEYIVERIRALEFDKGLRILANIGLAEFPLEARSLDALQTLADHRMYTAKRLNRPMLRPDELENLPTPKRRQSDQRERDSSELETPENSDS